MKLKNILALVLGLQAVTAAAQDTESPYKTSFKADAPVTAAGIGLSVLGLKLIQDKESLTLAELAALSKDDVNGFDRFSAGNYSKTADKHSYYPFYGAFAMPVVILFNGKINNHTGQVLALYVETMAITGTLYTMAAGNVKRNRPYTYSTETPLDQRTKKGATRSFYAGHTAATASATFFAAKVFSDFNPDSPAKPYIWTAAAVVPAAVGYLRLKAGMHFLSDNLLGYAVGAGVGVLVPQLHKKTSANSLSVVPVFTPGYQTVAATYTFR
ncbi:phosphatase PAP2 family protein [Hufsiella ginkgonis]|uniref:Phosphatase PAP2 family protein n=1 Tax=Hufsiella ginkgonis TaxID=2695274 RepID=A0A7K1XW98_9SPHI|nr:phosphatase PAP2 family protein [Hufsiella ginkgonis]MXV15255.1 phosphatase PAP2 family protein [Hufsiella ginkgonis]